MNELTWTLMGFGFLQVGSLVLLPKWWKLAAVPSLLVILPIIDYFQTGGGYMGEVFSAMFAIFGCAYMVLAWVGFGMKDHVVSK